MNWFRVLNKLEDCVVYQLHLLVTTRMELNISTTFLYKLDLVNLK